MELKGNEIYEKVRQEEIDASMERISKKVAKEEVKAAEMEELVKQERKIINAKLDIAKKKDDADRQKMQLKLKDVLKARSVIFFVIGMTASLLSVFMSCAGVSNSKSIDDLVTAAKGDYWIYISLMALLQGSIIVYAIYSYALGIYHNDRNTALYLYRFAVIAMSIYCNYKYMENVFDYEGRFNPIIFFFASGADIVSNIFTTTSTNMRYKIYRYKGGNFSESDRNIGLIQKLKIALFGKAIVKFEEAYREKADMLKEYYSSQNGSKSKVSETKEKAIETHKHCVSEVSESQNYERKKPENLNEGIEKMENLGLSVGDKVNQTMLEFSENEWKAFQRYLRLQGALDVEGRKTVLAKEISEIKEIVS